MAITSKYLCKTCDFAVSVEGTISPEIAIAACIDHLENNHSHVLPGPQTIWTDNPYTPPSEE